MPRIVLRRSDDSAASIAEAAAIVVAHQGHVLDRSDKTLLVDLAHPDAAASLRSKLHGWTVSEQPGAKIPVPDTRLKVRPGG